MADGLEMSTEILGVENLMANLLAVGAAGRTEAASGIYVEAEAIMADSREHFVPVEHGVLKDSGHVDLPVWDGDVVSTKMGYGGAASDYARIQHEDLTFAHPNGGGAKYLELPFMARIAQLADRLAARWAKAIVALGGQS